MKRTLTVRETAKKLGCTRKYVFDLLYDERLAGARKVGRTWRIPAPSVEEYAKQQGGAQCNRRWPLT